MSDDRRAKAAVEFLFGDAETPLPAPLPLISGDIPWSLEDERASLPPPARADGSPAIRLEVDDEGGFPRVLFRLWRQRRSGTLWIRAAGIETVIVLEQGTPISAGHGKLADTLGRLLVRLGKLSETDFAKAIKRTVELETGGLKPRFGDVLVELGMLSQGEVEQALAQQLRQKILSCFEQSSVEAWFDDREIASIATLDTGAVPRLLAAGCSVECDEREIDRLFDQRGAEYAVLVESGEAIANLLGLDPADRAIAETVDGRQTLLELLAGAAEDRLRLGALLIAFRRLELLRFQPAPFQRGERAVPPAPPARPDPPRVAHPLARLRARSRPGASPYAAEASFLSGKVFLERGERKAALERFRVAHEMSPSIVEYRLFYTYAEFLASVDKIQQPALIAKVRTVARAAVQQDPGQVRPHCILGHLARVEGDLEAAIAHFQRALELAPEDREAERELRLLTKRREESSPKKRFTLSWSKKG